MIKWDRDDPLMLCEDESRKSNIALRDYWALGPGRTLLALCKKYTKLQGTTAAPTLSHQTLKQWSTKYDWQARINQVKVNEDARVMAEWQARQAEWRQRGWEAAQALSDKVRLMLAFPISRKVVDNGDGTQTIIEPINWRASDVAKLMETASKLARASSQMTTNTPSTQLNIDMSQLTIEQLERIAQGENPLVVIADTSKG